MGDVLSLKCHNSPTKTARKRDEAPLWPRTFSSHDRLQGQATDTLAPRCFGKMRLVSLTRSDQRRGAISFGS
jgi:hypothetical protein